MNRLNWLVYLRLHLRVAWALLAEELNLLLVVKKQLLDNWCLNGRHLDCHEVVIGNLRGGRSSFCRGRCCGTKCSNAIWAQTTHKRIVDLSDSDKA